MPYADLGLQTGTIVFESMPQIFLVEATFYNIEQTQNLKQIDMIFFDMFSVCWRNIEKERMLSTLCILSWCFGKLLVFPVL